MDFKVDLNVFRTFKNLMEVAPETGAALLGSLLLFFILLSYRFYTRKEPIASYTPDLAGLSVSALISAFVAVGATAAAASRGQSPTGHEVHTMSDWGLLLISGGAVAMLFWFLSLAWAQRIARRKQDHLIACTLGWAAVNFRGIRAIRDVFRDTATDAKLASSNDFLFEQKLRVGLSKLDGADPTLQSLEDHNLLEPHITGEQSLLHDWRDLAANSLHMVAAYVILAFALTVLHLALTGAL